MHKQWDFDKYLQYRLYWINNIPTTSSYGLFSCAIVRWKRKKNACKRTRLDDDDNDDNDAHVHMNGTVTWSWIVRQLQRRSRLMCDIAVGVVVSSSSSSFWHVVAAARVAHETTVLCVAWRAPKWTPHLSNAVTLVKCSRSWSAFARQSPTSLSST